MAIDDAQLVALYMSGCTFMEISEQLGCSLARAHDRIAQLRAGGMDLPPRKPRWTKERRSDLARMRRQGVSLNDLEIEFERSRGTITSQLRTLRRLGYDVEPPAMKTPKRRGKSIRGGSR